MTNHQITDLIERADRADAMPSSTTPQQVRCLANLAYHAAFALRKIRQEEELREVEAKTRAILSK